MSLRGAVQSCAGVGKAEAMDEEEEDGFEDGVNRGSADDDEAHVHGDEDIAGDSTHGAHGRGQVDLA